MSREAASEANCLLISEREDPQAKHRPGDSGSPYFYNDFNRNDTLSAWICGTTDRERNMFYEPGDWGTGNTAEAFEDGLGGVIIDLRPKPSLTTTISPVLSLEKGRIFIRIIMLCQTWYLYHRIRASPS